MSNSDILAVQLWFGAAAIAFLAIAMTAAGWKHKVFVTAMFVVAAALAAVGIFFDRLVAITPTETAETLRSIANSKPAWLALFVLGTGGVFAIARLRGLGSTAPQSIPTSLRLQFYPNTLIPTCLDIHNVANWYSLRHSFTVVEGPSPQFPNGRQQEHRFWTLHVVFDRPVAFKQIVFDTHGVQIPPIEVKDRSSRHAVIMISGDMPAVIMDMSCLL